MKRDASGDKRIADVADAILGRSAQSEGDREGNGMVTTESTVRLPVVALFATHLGGHAADACLQYIGYHAERARLVAAVQIDGTSAGIDLYSLNPGSPNNPQPSNADSLEKLVDRLGLEVDRLVFAGPEAHELVDYDVLNGNAGICVLTLPHREDLVDTFGVLKHCRMKCPDSPLSVFVASAGDAEQARSSARRLHDMCDRFLHIPLPCDGYARDSYLPEPRSLGSCVIHPPGLGERADASVHLPRLLSTRAEPAGSLDVFNERASCRDPVLHGPWPIKTALVIEKPIATVQDLYEFARRNIQAFVPDTRRYGPVLVTGANHLRVMITEDADGQRTVLVLSISPPVGALELALAQCEADERVSRIVIASPHGPVDLQRRAARMLPVQSSFLNLRHVAIGQTYGVMIDPVQDDGEG